jgi:hypothetical protein
MWPLILGPVMGVTPPRVVLPCLLAAGHPRSASFAAATVSAAPTASPDQHGSARLPQTLAITGQQKVPVTNNYLRFWRSGVLDGYDKSLCATKVSGAGATKPWLVTKHRSCWQSTIEL